jgi:DNA-binding response OmpR family regulator
MEQIKNPLTPTEERLYDALSKRPGAVIGRLELLAAMWPTVQANTLEESETRMVDVYVGYLRKKGHKVESVRKFGYKLVSNQ